MKNQWNRKDKVIKTLLEKLEKNHHEEICPSRATTNGSPVVQTSSVIQGTSVKTQHDNINMNQDSSINSITKVQNPTQAITNTDVPPISKENTKNKSNIENEGNTICWKSAEQDQPNKNPKSKRDSAIILGDSMIKHTSGWEIAKKLKSEYNVFVRNFPGATTQWMADYMKPSIRPKPNHFILHVGTNDLSSNRPPDEIAKAIIDLASELKSEKSGVSISSIIMRADKPELNKKGSEVNHHLKEMCNRKNFYFIDHSKKIKASHLNSSRLHLNRKGANILSSSLTQHISKVFNWQLSGNTSCCNFSESDFEENESSNLKQAKENCRSVLNSLRKDNLDKLIFAHLNINSIRNKFNYLSEQIRGNVDILLVSETKIDDSFPQGQFVIDGFSAP